ncbi:MAG: 5' nucleotidase, NT5C type [Acidimicrobiales bacterium]
MPRQFVLGVDLDNVCADYTTAFRQVVANDRGVDPGSLTLIRSWGFEEWGLSDADYDRLHRLAVNERRILRHLDPSPGCADALWRLSDAGVWIRIITHRLYVNWGHAAAVSDTVEWLDEAAIPYRDLCFLGDKPEVGADLYIDDAPHNIEALRAAGNEVIVFDQPYNRDLPGPRATGWDEVEQIVLDAASARGWIQPQLPGIDAGADRLRRRRHPEPGPAPS